MTRRRIVSTRFRVSASPRRYFRPRGAFTLLELLISMAMVAALTVGLFASLRTAFRARDSAEAVNEPPRTAELAMEMVRTDLESALPPTGTIAGAFEGLNNSADFFTTADSPEHIVGNGEIKEVTLRLVTGIDSQGSTLVRQIQRNPVLATVAPTPDEEIICRNVSSVGFRYFDGSTWQTTWDSTQYNNVLPSAVEITLQFTRTPTGRPPQDYTFVRVFQLACSTTTTGSNGVGTGGSSGLSF